MEKSQLSSRFTSAVCEPVTAALIILYNQKLVSEERIFKHNTTFCTWKCAHGGDTPALLSCFLNSNMSLVCISQPVALWKNKHAKWHVIRCYFHQKRLSREKGVNKVSSNQSGTSAQSPGTHQSFVSCPSFLCGCLESKFQGQQLSLWSKVSWTKLHLSFNQHRDGFCSLSFVWHVYTTWALSQAQSVPHQRWRTSQTQRCIFRTDTGTLIMCQYLWSVASSKDSYSLGMKEPNPPQSQHWHLTMVT